MTQTTEARFVLSYLDIATTMSYWKHLDAAPPRRPAHGWRDTALSPLARGYIDQEDRTDTFGRAAFEAVAHKLRFDGIWDDFVPALRAIPWATVHDLYLSLGEPAVSVPHGAITAVDDDDVPDQFLSACVRAGLTDVRQITAAWHSGIPAEYAARAVAAAGVARAD